MEHRSWPLIRRPIQVRTALLEHTAEVQNLSPSQIEALYSPEGHIRIPLSLANQLPWHLLSLVTGATQAGIFPTDTRFAR